MSKRKSNIVPMTLLSLVAITSMIPEIVAQPAERYAPTVTFDREMYSVTDKALITVDDIYVDSIETVGNIEVQISSTSMAENITLSLVETGTDTGIFIGELAFNAEVSGDGTIKARPGDAIVASYSYYEFNCAAITEFACYRSIYARAMISNQPPLADNDSVVTREDNAVTIMVLSNDFDPDNDTIRLVSVSEPLNGSVVVNAEGMSVTYTPDLNFFGSDNFAYTISDGSLDATGIVSIAVGSVNDVPEAYDQSIVTDEDIPVVVNLSGSDIDAQTLAFSIVEQPTHGILDSVRNAGVNSGMVTYTPEPDFNGNDSFTFNVSDGELNSSIAIVNITVSPVADRMPSTISISASSLSVVMGQNITISGSISPPHAAAVLLKYTQPGASVFYVSVVSSTAGNYTHAYAPNIAGTWSVEASWEGDENYLEASNTIASIVVSDVDIVIDERKPQTDLPLWPLLLIPVAAVPILRYVPRPLDRPPDTDGLNLREKGSVTVNIDAKVVRE